MQLVLETHGRRLARALALVPLAVLLLVVALGAVAARGPVPGADATTVDLTGSIQSEVTLDASACGPTSGSIGEIVAGTDPWKTAQDASGQVCTFSFGTTNHGAGVDLVVLDDPSSYGVAGPAMRCTAGPCATRSLLDYSGSGEPSTGTSAFGAQLLSSSGAAAPVWGAAPAVNAVQDAGSTACRTSGTGTGSCSFTWGATAAPGDVPGAYVARVRSMVVAR